MPAASHPIPSPDRTHAPKRVASTTFRTLRVSVFTNGTIDIYYTVWIFICICMSPRVFLLAKKMKFLIKGGIHCISQGFPWHFYFMREHSLVELTEHDVVVVVVVDSHIQRIVLATEETTVTQQVSHRPIKRQSRLWSQRGTKVNGSHHGDNPLLRPTGIQIATKSYAALQAMAPTNIKTVHQTSLLHSRATSIDSECCRLPTTSVLSKKPEKLRSNQF